MKERYSSLDSGIGAEIEAGKADFKTLEAYMLKKGEIAPNKSGRQEMLENLLQPVYLRAIASHSSIRAAEAESWPPRNRPAHRAGTLEAECRRLTEALALAERDRQLLGYEIHDGVVQDLTAAAMLLEGPAGRRRSPPPRCRRAMPAACGCCGRASPRPAG